jgi:hypothetical protein
MLTDLGRSWIGNKLALGLFFRTDALLITFLEPKLNAASFAHYLVGRYHPHHNLDVLKTADWIIDIGPCGGEKGGYIVAQGTPEQVAKDKNSVTGKYLAKSLKNNSK